MKTIFIYDQCCLEPIKYFILNGNYSHLDKIYINEVSDTEEDELKQEELNELLFNSDTGDLKAILLDDFPISEITSDTVVISVGFFP